MDIWPQMWHQMVYWFIPYAVAHVHILMICFSRIICPRAQPSFCMHRPTIWNKLPQTLGSILNVGLRARYSSMHMAGSMSDRRLKVCRINALAYLHKARAICAKI